MPRAVWFVDLAPLSDPNLVIPTVMQTLGLKEQSGQVPLEQVLALAMELAAEVPPLAPSSAPTPPATPQPAVAAAAYPAGLTAREVEVLRLVAQGLTGAQVAERLIVSTHTVDAHLRSIYGKLDVSSRTAASRFAVDHHLV